MVSDQDGNLFYTRDGSFKLSVEDDEVFLVTSDGYFVQSDADDVELGSDIEEISVREDGLIFVKRTGEEEFEEIAQLLLVRFPNPAGLEAVGKNLYIQTPASRGC